MTFNRLFRTCCLPAQIRSPACVALILIFRERSLSNLIVMHRNRFSLILWVFLGACAGTGKPLVPPIDSTYTLRINQPFEALPNGTHIDFQHGLRVPQGNLDRWTTYCRLYVYNRFQGADYYSEVRIGEVEISAVSMSWESSHSPGHAWGSRHQVFRGVRDPPSYYLYRVGMRLTSPHQPDIRSLNCYRKWGSASSGQYPSLLQIREALGNLIEVVPGSDARAAQSPPAL